MGGGAAVCSLHGHNRGKLNGAIIKQLLNHLLNVIIFNGLDHRWNLQIIAILGRPIGLLCLTLLASHFERRGVAFLQLRHQSLRQELGRRRIRLVHVVCEVGAGSAPAHHPRRRVVRSRRVLRRLECS